MCVLHPDDMRCGSSVYVCTVHRGSVCYLIRCDVITMGYVCASLISQHHLVPSVSTSHLPHPLTPSLPPLRFNYRSTHQMVTHGFYDFLNWFDERAWYPLGRIVGGTVSASVLGDGCGWEW